MYIGNMAELGLGWVQYISGADADFVKGGVHKVCLHAILIVQSTWWCQNKMDADKKKGNILVLRLLFSHSRML